MNMKEVKNIKKSRIWYVILLILASTYVFWKRNEIYQMSELNVYNVMFIFWLILMMYPLFSEINICGIEIKKELAKSRQEFQNGIYDIRMQLLTLSNNNNNNISINTAPLPSVEEIEKLSSDHKSKVMLDNNSIAFDLDIEVSQSNVFLFKVRVVLERYINDIYNKNKYDNSKMGVMLKVRCLKEHRKIDFALAKLIEQVLTIANRGIHGEIISEEYIEFVRGVFPQIQKSLNNITEKSGYDFLCTKCGYRGISEMENQCPQCGFTSDEY